MTGTGGAVPAGRSRLRPRVSRAAGAVSPVRTYVLAAGLLFTPADLRTGAQVLYCGGDLVEAAVAAVVAASWYRATGRARQRRRPDPGPASHTVEALTGPQAAIARARRPGQEIDWEKTGGSRTGVPPR
ncbi:hypothetical protein ACFY7H_13645 [Streptomyces sp. NPDC012794]|uniref:hypothetical protein n=1 Tax=Streptomyces sp. NPDC012794 TaxID=3364850 RepID=UPI0036A26511